MSVQFGLRVPMVGPPQETGAYAARVEAAGFDFMWMPDTPLLAGRWRDVYMHLTCAALETTKLRLGPGVTNPITRHPVTTASAAITLDEVSRGRADLTVGTGYSSAYIIGRKAATLAAMRQATQIWHGVFSGARTELGGLEIELDLPRPRLPVYLAGSGPKALQLAGEIADGVIIMVGAVTGCVEWALEQVETGMARAGRKRAEVRRILVVSACIDDDRGRAIDTMRPCVASLCRHRHADLLFARAGLEVPEIPHGIAAPYPDLGHAINWEEAKQASSYIPDDAVEAMIALGTGAQVAAQIRPLIDLDLDAIWWRADASWARPDALMQALSEDVLPRLRA